MWLIQEPSMKNNDFLNIRSSEISHAMFLLPDMHMLVHSKMLHLNPHLPVPDFTRLKKIVNHMQNVVFCSHYL